MNTIREFGATKKIEELKKYDKKLKDEKSA